MGAMPEKSRTYGSSEMQEHIKECPRCGDEMSVDWIPTRDAAGTEKRWLLGRAACSNPRCV